MQESGVRRAAWEGAGNHGFVYMDSLADTGGTLVPRRARTAGATGAFGDPLFEALIDKGQGFFIFAVALGQNAMPLVDDAYAWDVVTITPQRERLRRPEISVMEVAPQVIPEMVAPLTVQVALPEVLTKMRAHAGLPVGDLAAMLGVSRRQFYNWVGGENEPDREQEDRVRWTAEMIEGLAQVSETPRRVRGTLLARTDFGTAFDAFSKGELDLAARALEAAAGLTPRDVPAPSQQVFYDRDEVLLELEHQRDVPRRGDD